MTVPGLSDGKRLFVRGPNVMAGYLFADNPGVIVSPEGGWHDTGDIVTIEDGFIAIRGRAKRFAKLGGEMVSLAAVETLACGLWSDAQHVVLSFPDPRKGEQLLLVTDKPEASKDALLAHARKRGLSRSLGAERNSRRAGRAGAGVRQDRPAGDRRNGAPGPSRACR